MSTAPGTLLIGKNAAGAEVSLLLNMANRHGLVAGATGTGKTVTLQLLAEQFSAAGTPVFTADIKGDLSGVAQAGQPSEKLTARLNQLKISDHQFRTYPVLFWDVYAKAGHPVRATVSEMGPLLLARILGLNETQEQVLQLAFRIADEQKLLLLDLKDLRQLLSWIGDHASDLKSEYGNIAGASIGTIQRNLLNLSDAGGSVFFGEPALNLQHLMQKDFSGNGVISVLDATTLMNDPRLYATFLLWLLSELFEQLDEVGDLPQPRLVFFFDEAHLLFKDAPNALVQKIEQVVRLIRSKGVGIYFVTQNPMDIPESVLGQLGNRIQHALRAYTPSDQKAVKTAAQTFRPNPTINTELAITELAVGEALVSVLDDGGRPTPVERVLIAPPHARIGRLDPAARAEVIGRSPIKGVYEAQVDRESAYEILKKKSDEQAAKAPSPASATPTPSFFESLFKSDGRRQSAGEAMVKSMMRSMGSTVGRQIMRGIMGSFTGDSRRR